MDLTYFRQIELAFKQKAEIVSALMRYIVSLNIDVLRSSELNKQFIAESGRPSWLSTSGETDPWLDEHVARLFWTCCELGFLKYQYLTMTSQNRTNMPASSWAGPNYQISGFKN